MKEDDPFRIRPGRIKSTRSVKTKSFVSQVLRAAKTAGHFSGAPRPGRSAGIKRSTFGRGRVNFSRARLFSPQRQVIVKARVVRHAGRAFRSAPMSAHLSYLARDGVTRDGEDAAFFGKDTDQVDDRDFSGRCHGDRHHFRFIISPEDASDMTDLRAFTRDLADQMEADLGTPLDWLAVDHWNTDNPHVHLLVRGVAADGADLVIARDYVSRGLRSRAEDLVGIELGPRPEHEIRTALERNVTAERWTKLDQQLRFAVDETGHVDLRPVSGSGVDRETRRLMVGRCQHLQKMGLTHPAGPGQWIMGLEAERTLRDLGLRGDIIKTMHLAFTSRGSDRAVTDYCIDELGAGAPILGRLVGKGLHDELTGEAYVVIDATDGRAHHVRLKGVEAFANAPPIGGIVEVRRIGRAEEQRPTLVLAPRSDIDLGQQIKAPGAMWLDHRLVEAKPMPLSLAGFGGEVRDAMQARAEHLVAEGLGRRRGQRIILQRDLLATLLGRELDAVGARISAETGLSYMKPTAGEQVAGIYRQRLALSSGRFAMIESGLGFQLVPWSREIERKLGQKIAGITKDGGGIEWDIGRRPGLTR
jgi:type IV secretory pathway VirD2 relaxase